jgi:hypothetical protein
MTAVSTIITAAFRKGQIIAKVSTPDATEQSEALGMLNPIVLSAVGFEVGEELSDLNIGGAYDQSSYCANWIPPNARLILNLSGAATYKTHPEPYEGMRLAIADAGSNLATNNLTLNGNGRNIEGTSTVTLSTSSDARQWLYRADTANWVKITSLVWADQMPFPQEFDQYFINTLATELNPQNGVTTAPEVVAAQRKYEAKLRARYRKPRPVQDMGTLGLMGQRRGAYGLSTQDFNAGRTWRW